MKFNNSFIHSYERGDPMLMEFQAQKSLQKSLYLHAFFSPSEYKIQLVHESQL